MVGRQRILRQSGEEIPRFQRERIVLAETTQAGGVLRRRRGPTISITDYDSTKHIRSKATIYSGCCFFFY